jgi:hypothetical protein
MTLHGGSGKKWLIRVDPGDYRRSASRPLNDRFAREAVPRDRGKSGV